MTGVGFGEQGSGHAPRMAHEDDGTVAIPNDTCTMCGGSGRTNDGSECPLCKGHGYDRPVVAGRPSRTAGQSRATFRVRRWKGGCSGRAAMADTD